MMKHTRACKSGLHWPSPLVSILCEVPLAEAKPSPRVVGLVLPPTGPNSFSLWFSPVASIFFLSDKSFLSVSLQTSYYFSHLTEKEISLDPISPPVLAPFLESGVSSHCLLSLSPFPQPHPDLHPILPNETSSCRTH